MNSISVLGKYLDQPKLVAKFAKTVPVILTAGGLAYAAHDSYKAPKEERKKVFLKDAIILSGTIISALFAPKIASSLVERHHHHHHHLNIPKLIDDFLQNNEISQKSREILSKAKEKILSFSEVRTVFEELGENPKGKKLLNILIPNPENIDSKHIFGEINWLSIMGAIPVIGGVLSGIAADRLTEKEWKGRIPNKIKEGSYQYLSNIFLCNVGAGAALLAMEKSKITSKSARAMGMISGIILVGVVMGSLLANLIGRVVVDPLLGQKHKHKKGEKCLVCERTPELLDISLHTDDIATVAVLSGLKWIEPALPILYSISGYRAGIGYRNGGEGK